MEERYCVLVREPGAAVPAWAALAEPVEEAALAEGAGGAVRAALHEASCVLLDGAGAGPVRLARRVHTLDPAIQVVVVVAGAEQRASIQRAMLFTPGLGEVWLVEPDEVDAGLLRRAGAVTRQRRVYRATHARVEHDLALLEPSATRRAVISDAFLAALLQVLPDPVISIDDDGRVLSWTPAAEAVLGLARVDAVGRSLAELLCSGSPQAPESALRAAEGSASPVELRFVRGNGEERVGEVTVAPVDAGGRSVRAVVLRDVTEARRAQQELEMQAVELEAQASAMEAQNTLLEEMQLELELANEELQRTNAELVERTAEAEAANRAKSQFLATMSHEIRTPINAVVGYTDLLDAEVAGPVNEAQRAYLGRIRTSSRHLTSLIGDVLDMAKIESGRVEVHPRPVHAEQAVEAALPLVQPQAAAKGLTLSGACVADAGVVVHADPSRLQQILVNLLNNAIKFTEPGGRITVTCGWTDEAVQGAAVAGAGPWGVIRIQDTGIGIPAERMESIWAPFEQAHSGRTREKEGAGLGLAISRSLARLMGGDLVARSQPGSGSTFFLLLPAAHAAVGAPAQPPRERRGPERHTPGVSRVGHAVLTEIERILQGYLARLRTDPGVVSARHMSEAALEDHAATLLVDIVEALNAVDEAAGDASDVVRDSQAIQQAVAERHGRSRASYGWSADEVRRDYQILREELERAVRRRAERDPSVHPGDDEAAIESGLALFARFIERAERTSLAELGEE